MCSGPGLHNDAAKAKMLPGIFRRKTQKLAGQVGSCAGHFVIFFG